MRGRAVLSRGGRGGRRGRVLGRGAGGGAPAGSRVWGPLALVLAGIEPEGVVAGVPFGVVYSLTETSFSCRSTFPSVT